MKKWLATLLLGAALTLTALPVAAQGTDGTVTMNADGSQASVSLTLPQEAAQDVTALRLSFQVDSSNGAKAQFDFNDGLTSSVQQYRYNEETGRLTVYIAGRDELLKDGTVSLGEIQLDAAPGTIATVRVVEDSLELVNATYGKAETTAVAAASADLSTADVETPVPTQTPAAPEATEPPVAPEATEKPSSGNESSSNGSSGGSSSTSQGGTSSQSTAAQTPAPTPEVSTSPVDTSAPVQAVQGTTSTVSGSSKPSGGKATPKPSASPEPSSTPQASATPAPSAAPEYVAETATPEQTVQEQTSGLNASLVIAIVLGVLAVAALVAVAVIWFRGR